MFSSGTQTKLHLKRLAISIVILGGVLTLPFRSFADVDDPKPTARISAVLWDDEEVAELRDPLVVVTRGPGGCPPTEGVVRKGVPLCKDDIVKLARKVKLRIVFGELNGGDEVTLGQRREQDQQPYSEVKISSVWCGALCHWFASLSNRYTNRVQHVSLTNKSTVYEVHSYEDKSVELTVFEGEVELERLASDTAGDPNAAAAPEAAPAPVSTPQSIPRMYKATINADGTISDKQVMDIGKFRSSLAFSTAAEVLRHRTPPEYGGSLAKSPNFPNSAARSDAFETARFNSFWEPSQGLHFETLGYVYIDWGDGPKALEMFDKAIKLYEASPNWTGPTDKLRINRAMALRQRAHPGKQADDQTEERPDDLKTALTELEPVLAATSSTLTGSALNVRGSIYYDQARRELLYNRTTEGLANAKELLAKASADFDKALPLAGTQRQYIEVNRGQVLKAEGDIAQREGNYALAETKYIEAIKKLMDAYGHDADNPRNKIASLLVARARADLANTYAVMRKPAQSKDFYDKADATYTQLIDDARTQGQNFAAPYCGLGSLDLILRPERAAENYAACVAFNPVALIKDVPVPNVVDLRRADAIDMLTEAGLVPEIMNIGEIVETQEPVAQTLKVGSRIKIKLRGSER